jgi:uncharacterized membrane protein YeaQ/YmgE (transglycosylase-associated protein family)
MKCQSVAQGSTRSWHGQAENGKAHLEEHWYDRPKPIIGRSFAWAPPHRPLIGGRLTVGIIAWIVLGAIAGWITNMIMGGKEGVIATIILGIVGAVVGGWLAGTVLKVADVTGVNVESIVVAVIGAVIVVAVYRAVMGRRTAV